MYFCYSSLQTMKRVSIVGYGRFGRVLHRLIKNDCIVTVYNRSEIKDRTEFTANTIVANTIADIYKSDTIFYAVPIDAFETVINNHKKHFKDHHVLIDVLSVKLHPAYVLGKYLKGMATQAILTHPMFGPDSSRGGFEGLPLIIDQFTSDQTQFTFWKNYFKSKKLNVLEMTPREHDRLAAKSQGLTHFIGRLMADFGLQPSSIDSMGTKKLLEVKEQTCNDTWTLFTNLQHYNPYTKAMRIKLGNTYDKLYNKLIPRQIIPDRITYGIQGGKGSFNEEAIQYFTQRAMITKYTVKYLYTSMGVMRALHEGSIDRGQFAIHNSAGGMVEESIHALAKYKCTIVEEFAIKISHALMIREDADFSKITTVMTHPQVLAQCKQTLHQKYPHLLQTSGKGTFVDHAMVARAMGKKRLPRHIATMGSKVLAKLYGLKIVEDKLQDLKENYTTFLHVAR